jgi:hypothetical protein
MPIMDRTTFTDSRGKTMMVTSPLIEIIDFVYDYMYCPIKKYVNKQMNSHDDITHKNMLHTLTLIEDMDIYNDLLFCLENKDNKNEKLNIESIIRKYNKNIDDNINTICYYLINCLDEDDK